MEHNELLKPRYKVIAEWPWGVLTVGDIVMQYLENETIWRQVLPDGSWTNVTTRNPEKYPHLFKKMEWWKERSIEDMPEYVRCIKDDFHPDCVPYYAKVDSFTNNGIIFEGSTNKERTAGYMHYKSFEPATKEEYEAHNSKP